MKQSKTVLKELTAAYRAVLRHGILCNAIALGLVAMPAMAETTAKTSYGASAVWTGLNGQELVGSGATYNSETGVVTANLSEVESTFGALTNLFGRDARADGDGDHVALSGLNLTNSTFSNNTGTVGGAMSLWQDGRTVGTEVTDTLYPDGKVPEPVSNTISSTTFTGNTAKKGGAFATLALKGFETREGVEFNNVTFEGNSATGTSSDTHNGGGALYLEATNATINNSTLTNNSATTNGGAVYNAGTLTIDNSTFANNYSSGNSGAIANSSQSASLTLTNTAFNNNHSDWGGAIVARGNVDITGGSFAGNYSNGGGGAIYLATLANKGHKLSINGTTFTGNHTAGVGVDGGGAIGSFSDLKLKNATFTGNYVEGSSDGGGAIFMGSVSTNDIQNTEFSQNTSTTGGGAIGSRTFALGNNSGATLDITGSTFTNNSATTSGGAIDNYLYNDANDDGYVKITDSTFTSNSAADGGAIYNHKGTTADILASGNPQVGAIYISDSTFTGNTATYGGAIDNEGTMTITNATFTDNASADVGGAIYNYGTLTLAGNNTFSGNIAGSVANDIYNDGFLNINSGTTTIDGGINGDDGTLTIVSGATLNIGTASIVQNSITLNGTMLATVRSGDDAQITANTKFDGNGELKLSFADAGTYKVFGGKIFDNVDVSSSVYDLNWDEGDLIVSKKSVEDIAADNNLSTETATAISGLMASTSETLNDLAVVIQEKLASGTDEDRAEVEHAQAAIHPETESVVQSVSSSVQNTVASLASGRMSMPTIGRNGGDVKMTSGGVWAQGIFNKSKQNDAFNGYTRGIAAGLDGTINKVWTIGAGYAFAHSDISGTARDTEIDSSSVFVYGQYKPSAWYMNLVANYTMADYSESGVALGTGISAKYDVDSFGANIATGYDFAGGITPELGLRYMHINSSDYINSLGIKNELADADYLTATLGTKYAFDIKATKRFTLRPELNYGIKYDMLSDKQVATVTMPGVNAYALNGERLSRIAGEFGIGLTMNYRGLDLSLNYDIEAREDYTSQSGRVKFRYNF